MPSSSRRMRSFSASESARRARRATWSTSFIVIFGSAMVTAPPVTGTRLASCSRRRGERIPTIWPPYSPSPRTSLELFQVSVLQREALAADAGEVDGGNDVAAFSLDPVQEPLAPARVAELRADAEWQGVVLHRRRQGYRCSARHGRRGLRRVEQHELRLRDFEQKTRGLPRPIALDAPVEGVGEPQPLFRPCDADVKEPALLLELLGVVHGARVREDTLLQPGEEDRGELEPLGRVKRHERDSFV